MKTVKMDEGYAMEILLWKYNPPYELYNNELSERAINELLECGYRAILNEHNELMGFYCTGDSAQVPAGRSYGVYSMSAVDIGIGMKPEFTGQGLGSAFFSFILNELLSENTPQTPIRLTVAAFNERAIKLYENKGFVKEGQFSNGANSFFTMVMS